MKYLLFLVVSSLMLFSSFYIQSDSGAAATVKKVHGKDVYILCKPVKEFKVVKDFKNKKLLVPSCNIYNIVEAYIEKAEKEKVKFDALYVDELDDIYCIKITG